jgi:hypothetical protein
MDKPQNRGELPRGRLPRAGFLPPHGEAIGGEDVC